MNDVRFMKIFKRSVWLSAALNVLAEAALNMLCPYYYSEPTTRSAKILDTISSLASRAIVPMSFFSLLQAARVYKIEKTLKAV